MEPSDVAVEMYPPISSQDKGLERRLEDGNVVTVQGDQFFGTQGVLAVPEADDEREEIIRCDNIHKTYLLGIEGVPALRGVTLSIKRAEFVVIYGSSGGGKSTLLNVLGTIDKPTRGYLHVCGVKVGAKTPDADVSRLRLQQLGFVFQTFNLLSSLTALENVEMPMILAGQLSAPQRRRRAKELLTAVGMGHRFDHLPSQLSGGEQQRVTIARSIANAPDILLLDEPTGDLDSVATLRVMSLLTRLNKEQGITLVMVTHDMGLKYFADRVLWMRDGKLQRVEEVSEDKRRQMHETLRRDVESLDATDADTAPQTESASQERWANTTVRKPVHYEAVRGMEALERDLFVQNQAFRQSRDKEEQQQQEEEDVLVWPAGVSAKSTAKLLDP